MEVETLTGGDGEMKWYRGDRSENRYSNIDILISTLKKVTPCAQDTDDLLWRGIFQQDIVKQRIAPCRRLGPGVKVPNPFSLSKSLLLNAVQSRGRRI